MPHCRSQTHGSFYRTRLISPDLVHLEYSDLPFFALPSRFCLGSPLNYASFAWMPHTAARRRRARPPAPSLPSARAGSNPLSPNPCFFQRAAHHKISPNCTGRLATLPVPCQQFCSEPSRLRRLTSAGRGGIQLSCASSQPLPPPAHFVKKRWAEPARCYLTCQGGSACLALVVAPGQALSQLLQGVPAAPPRAQVPLHQHLAVVALRSQAATGVHMHACVHVSSLV